MSDPKSPGVYILELSSGVKPIAGAGTSTAAFVGLVERCNPDDLNKAAFIPNWTRFVEKFGSFFPNGYLAYSVYGFFAEGGTSCYVVPLVPDDADKAFFTIKDNGTVAADSLNVTANLAGSWGNRINVTIEDASKNKDSEGKVIDAKLFKLTITYQKDVMEVYDRISLFDIAAKVNGVSSLVTVEVLTALPTDPAEISAFKTRPANVSNRLDQGADGTASSVDFIGSEQNKRGLHAFDPIDGINIVAIPDKPGDSNVAREGIIYCQKRKDCFFLVDPPYGTTDVKSFRSPFNSSYAALYYPWVIVTDPLTGRQKPIPPSGMVAGTYAYTDSTRGVHKAPAGIVEGYLDWAAGVETVITSTQQEQLNPEGINVIRSLPEGICIWGARTLSRDSEWTYVNVRRLLTYIEKSVEAGTQWVVFEPNTPELWGNVKRNLTAFLTRVWRDGALFGSIPDEAFFVKVDEENNPSDVRDLGQLIIEVGVAPVKPAEFVIIKIMQKTLSK